MVTCTVRLGIIAELLCRPSYNYNMVVARSAAHKMFSGMYTVSQKIYSQRFGEIFLSVAENFY